ncbi:unnamed protein product [Urochloa humidicola]
MGDEARSEVPLAVLRDRTASTATSPAPKPTPPPADPGSEAGQQQDISPLQCCSFQVEEKHRMRVQEQT